MVPLMDYCHLMGMLDIRLGSIVVDADRKGPVMESCEPRSPTSQPPDAECLTAVHTAVQEADARDIFRQLILLVDYLHRMGVARRNIKLESIALEGDRRHPVARLVDLGPAVLRHASIKADGLEPASHVGYTGAPPLAPCQQLLLGPPLAHYPPRLAVPIMGVLLQLCVSLPSTVYCLQVSRPSPCLPSSVGTLLAAAACQGQPLS